MATYSAYLPPEHFTGERMSDFRLVPDTKAPFALIFPPVWLAVKGLWLELLAWAVVTLAIILLAVWQPGPPIAYLSALPGLYLLLEGQELVRKKLERDGWQYAGIVEAENADEAEIRFSHEHPEPVMSAVAVSQEHPRATHKAHPAPKPAGLFPE